jgi:hypothetical protein
MEAQFNHLNHATWEWYHVVFTPKYRKMLTAK